MDSFSSDSKVTTEERIKQLEEDIKDLRESNFCLSQLMVKALTDTIALDLILQERGIIKRGEIEARTEDVEKFVDDFEARINFMEKCKGNGGRNESPKEEPEDD